MLIFIYLASPLLVRSKSINETELRIFFVFLFGFFPFAVWAIQLFLYFCLRFGKNNCETLAAIRKLFAAFSISKMST